MFPRSFFMSDKYGFVYIWLDRKYKRYYVGCRWGHEDDGYICSSTWMKQAYKHRPHDFKRRILARITTTKKELLEEEYHWLQMIKDEELNKKYYNLHNDHFGHWSANPDARNIGEKISASHKADPNWASWSKNKPKSEEQRAKIAASVAKVWERPGYR